MNAIRPQPMRAERLDAYSEQHADKALHHLSMLRDHLVLECNERVAAELVEAALLLIQDACRVLLARETV